MHGAITPWPFLQRGEFPVAQLISPPDNMALSVCPYYTFPLTALDLLVRMYYLSPQGDSTEKSMYFNPTPPFAISLLPRI